MIIEVVKLGLFISLTAHAEPVAPALPIAPAEPIRTYINTDCVTSGDGSTSSCAVAEGKPGAYISLSDAFNKLKPIVPQLLHKEGRIITIEDDQQVEE